MSDPLVQQLQAYIKATKPLGVGYALPADGVMTPQFEAVLGYLQSAFSGDGHKISLLNGKLVNPSGVAQLQKLLSPAKPETQDKKPAEDKSTTEKPEDREIKTLDKKPGEEKNTAWESFLGQSLPVVGKLYDGDIEKAAKNLEAAIGKEIGKSMAGVIWNDSKKSFNTTPDDIRSALNKIQEHKKTATKTAEFTQDQRVLKFAELLQNWAVEKK